MKTLIVLVFGLLLAVPTFAGPGQVVTYHIRIDKAYSDLRQVDGMPRSRDYSDFRAFYQMTMSIENPLTDQAILRDIKLDTNVEARRRGGQQSEASRTLGLNDVTQFKRVKFLGFPGRKIKIQIGGHIFVLDPKSMLASVADLDVEATVEHPVGMVAAKLPEGDVKVWKIDHGSPISLVEARKPCQIITTAVERAMGSL